MSDELRVRYLFVNMKLSNYIALGAVMVLITLGAAIATYATLHDHEIWPLSKVWIVLAAAVPLEIVEAWIAVRRAKQMAAEGKNKARKPKSATKSKST